MTLMAPMTPDAKDMETLEVYTPIAGSPLKHKNDCDTSRTDSGYASAFRPDSHQSLPATDAEQTNDDERNMTGNEDARTIISAVTEVTLDVARQHIGDVCNDMHQRIHGQVLPGNRKALSQPLPSLIKEFAIRIGYGSSNYLGRRIMLFIYGRHREIAATLGSIIGGNDDDEKPDDNSTINRFQGGMSLEDKMAMWDNAQGDHPQPDVDDRFQGVEDVNDESILTPSERSEYTQAILGSQAYEWLIDSLLRAS
ncbi:hypothetical protein B0T21DRAFT_60636 [Apiosordaria backusii]|uniref:Uncharacterized protein n=1 Tax=Apiosordaria backusii TaxID=314023 RepID=A0AA40ANF7_9PEZI|nr:hypothetical protein B0T21DRAFT_60636 [Apiosordaria backusii]